MSTKVSVIICTHNPRADYLQKTLDALEEQSLSKNEWELILIDNASERPLKAAEVASGELRVEGHEDAVHLDLSWHPNARIVREEKLGLTSARLRAIEEALGENLVFVDDDNILAPDYLEQAVSVGIRLPSIGCFGAGNIFPEFEVLPGPEVLPFTNMLALRQSDHDKWSNQPDDDCIPWGAGMVIKKEVAHQHVASLKLRATRIQLDRSGQELNSCGDSDFSWTACGMGLGKGIFSTLQVTHLIPKARIEKNYLLHIAEGHGFSHAMLRAIHGKEIRKSDAPGTLWAVAGALFRLRFSSFVNELQKWNLARGRPYMKKQIVQAWNRGNDRAFLLVNEAQATGSSFS